MIYPLLNFNIMMEERNLKKMPEVMVRDYELGLEWQPIRAFELVATWVIDRTFEDSALRNNRQQGNLLRLQAQFNFLEIIQECENIRDS
jgi:hypothetical protein